MVSFGVQVGNGVYFFQIPKRGRRVLPKSGKVRTRERQVPPILIEKYVPPTIFERRPFKCSKVFLIGDTTESLGGEVSGE